MMVSMAACNDAACQGQCYDENGGDACQCDFLHCRLPVVVTVVVVIVVVSIMIPVVAVAVMAALPFFILTIRFFLAVFVTVIVVCDGGGDGSSTDANCCGRQNRMFCAACQGCSYQNGYH
ncbi:hypothetical protein IAJ44_004324 [Salmonella enterica]|nr:hypothetical protein [Salmonella enterica]